MLVPLEIGTARRVTRAPRRQELVGRCGALLPLFRLVGVPCIATLWRVESLPRHRGDRPKLNFKIMGPVRSRSGTSEWLPFLNTYRTMCLAPQGSFRRLLEEMCAHRRPEADGMRASG